MPKHFQEQKQGRDGCEWEYIGFSAWLTEEIRSCVLRPTLGLIRENETAYNTAIWETDGQFFRKENSRQKRKVRPDYIIL